MADWGDAVDAVNALVEDTVPEAGLPEVRTRKPVGTHDQETRKLIALIILGMVGVFYTAVLMAFIFGRIDMDELHGAVTSFSGLQALAAAAIGFYYGSKRK